MIKNDNQTENTNKIKKHLPVEDVYNPKITSSLDYKYNYNEDSDRRICCSNPLPHGYTLQILYGNENYKFYLCAPDNSVLEIGCEDCVEDAEIKAIERYQEEIGLSNGAMGSLFADEIIKMIDLEMLWLTDKQESILQFEYSDLTELLYPAGTNYDPLGKAETQLYINKKTLKELKRYESYYQFKIISENSNTDRTYEIITPDELLERIIIDLKESGGEFSAEIAGTILPGIYSYDPLTDKILSVRENDLELY